jgi:hypothetical protein
MDALSTTSPFATLDAIHGALATQIYEVLTNSAQPDEDWRRLVVQNETLKLRLESQGIQEPTELSNIPWDEAVLFFTCTLILSKDGTPIQLGDQKTRERFGRFPHPGGSTMEYILANISPSEHKNRSKEEDEIYDELASLLEQLAHRCTDSFVGHEHFTHGSGGLHISGFLNETEVQSLRLHLASRVWTVSKDEPLDGGLADAIRHLISILKAAERRGAGIILRYHS